LSIREWFAVEFASIREVADGLERLEGFCLPRRDRRGIFATAYLQITRAIETAIAAGVFHDPEWVTRYLVGFGNLYRQALVAYEVGDRANVPKAWRIAFDEARDGTGLVIQHLILGINAHINHDLAIALAEVGIDPDRPRKFDDHRRVNEVLALATESLKSQVSTMYAPLLQRVDWVAGRLDDDATRFSIPRARDHAWSFAVALVAARSEPERGLLLRSLDEQAAVMAQLVLAPVTRHPVLLRTVRTADRVDRAVRRFWGKLGGG
jgi:hypothetical protein